MKRLFLLLLLAVFSLPSSFAQDNFSDYSWTFANIFFRYPASWVEPVQLFETESGRVNMFVSQYLVEDSESIQAEIPFITISLLREVTEETDIYQELENDLEAIGINPIGQLPGSMLDSQSVATRGLSNDGQLFGIGQAIELEEEGLGILIIYGRSPIAQRDTFVGIFNAVSNSLSLSASSGSNESEFGVLWHQSTSSLDGDDAFLDLAGIAYAPDGKLYAVDNFLGLLQIDAETGLIEEQIPLGDALFASDIAIALDNSIYVADLNCSCIHVIVDGVEVDTIEGFGVDAPESIAVTIDNTLYATDLTDEGVILRAFGDGETEIAFDFAPFSQPLLTIDRDGDLIGLVDTSLVYKISDGIFTEHYELSANIFSTALTVDENNQLIVATEGDAIVIFDSEGNETLRVGVPSQDVPLAGEILSPTGVAVSTDTIYWVDSGGTYGNITAMSTNVEAGRVGSSNIQSGNVVQGILSDSIPQQVWTFDAVAGDVVTLTAVADFLASDLDLALKLLAPDGQELSYVDDPEESLLLNPFDPQIDNLRLQRDGQYIVIVETVFDEGRYSLGLSVSETLDVTSGQAQLTGALSEEIPVQRWLFDGRTGQAIEITMTTTSATLDPTLVLLNPNGTLVEENDDALDSALGLNAQITDITLPSNGQYIIEARRFDGEGVYELTVDLE